MKKLFIVFLSLIILLLCTACDWSVKLNMDGIYKCNSPKMRLNAVQDPNNKILGEMIMDDGSTQKIQFSSMHGRFSIAKYIEENSNEGYTEPYFIGKYYKKDGLIVLVTDNGQELFLSKIAEKIDFNIDDAFEQDFRQARFIKGRTRVCLDYLSSWQEYVKTYYKCLLDNYLGNKDTIIKTQEVWQQYCDYTLNNYKEYISSTYDIDTTIDFYVAKKEYELYRARAIELYNQCAHLIVDVPEL